MKFGVSAYSFKRLLQAGKTYFDVCDMALDMGYEGIEFVDLQPEHGGAYKSQSELAAAICAHCEKIGLPIIAYTVSADFLNGRNGTPEEEVQRIKTKVDTARLLGAKILRHDAFWKLQGLRSWQDAVDRIVPGVREVAEYALQQGVRTCSENHGMIMQDSRRMEYLINSVNHENYGWLVDIGNFLCVDEAPEYAVGVAAPYAVHAHVKDFLYKRGTEMMPEGHWLTTRGGNYLRGTVVGHGVVPVCSCLKTLSRSGYDGYVSVEFEGAEETAQALSQAIAYLRRVEL